MHSKFKITRENSFLDTGLEVIPLLIDKRALDGQKIEFNGNYVDFYKEEVVHFVENSVVPVLVKDTLALLDFEDLDLSDLNILKSYELAVAIGDILSPEQIRNISWDVKILSIRIAKVGVRDTFYVEGWVLDPLKRLWQICPGEFSEGWFRVDQGFEDMGSEYSQLNDINLNALIR